MRPPASLPPISVVVPVYAGRDTVAELVERLRTTLDDHAVEWELVLVDDASPDESWTEISRLAKDDHRIRGIRLGANDSQHCATLAGLRVARYDTFVTLDDDLQDPPEAVIDLVSQLGENTDIVYGVARNPAALGGRAVMARYAKRLLGATLGVAGADQIGSFRAFRRELVDLLPDAVDRSFVIDSAIAWYTTSRDSVLVDATARRKPSRYRFRDLARLAIDAPVSFGAGRLRILTPIGLVLAGAGSLAATRALARGRWSDLGTSTLVSASGLNLVAISVVAEHASRTQARTGGRMPYWVRETTD